MLEKAPYPARAKKKSSYVVDSQIENFIVFA